MQYMKLTEPMRQELWDSLNAMHQFLQQAFGSLDDEEASTAGPTGAFSPVEQVWHLADLEAEGFGARIRRLQTESNPVLPDFDGTKAARERHYRSKSLAAGLAAFRAARLTNLAALQSLTSEEWSRSGTQEGVGVVSLCDMPAFIGQHDSAHKAEIDDWKQCIGNR
jgi:hypothetical protein